VRGTLHVDPPTGPISRRKSNYLTPSATFQPARDRGRADRAGNFHCASNSRAVRWEVLLWRSWVTPMPLGASKACSRRGLRTQTRHNLPHENPITMAHTMQAFLQSEVQGPAGEPMSGEPKYQKGQVHPQDHLPDSLGLRVHLGCLFRLTGRQSLASRPALGAGTRAQRCWRRRSDPSFSRLPT